MMSGINQSLAHGIAVLFLYDAANPSLTVSEISQRLGYTQSKAYRIVRTLVSYGCLTERPGTARYSLGMNVLRLGLLAQQEFKLSSIARPMMKELSVVTNETIVLTAVNGTTAVVLDRVESSEPIRFSLFQPGVSLPLHCGASSKILMAYLREDEWDRIVRVEGLKRYNQNTITDVTALKNHLREIREKGYAYSNEEVDRDVKAIAAPILDAAGELLAGVSIAGPAYRITSAKTKKFAKLVMQCAQNISNQLRVHTGQVTNPSIL
jgi:IclR family transcriptional regulator, KDG regulon repressor